MDEQNIGQPVPEQMSNNGGEGSGENDPLPEDVLQSLEFQRLELRKIRIQVTEMSVELRDLSVEVNDVVELLEEQMKSSWEMREIIQGVKSKLDHVYKMFEGIDLRGIAEKLVLLTPDFGKVKDTITGKFKDLKDTVGEFFSDGEQATDVQDTQEGQEGQERHVKAGNSIRDSINSLRDRIKRKFTTWK